MRVLLVEDNQDSRETYRTMLEKLGYDVIEAVNGKEAIEVALDGTPDLILMDLSMPEVDGLVATAALRSITIFTRLPIIAMTAYPQALSFNQAKRAGCDGYLAKPFTQENLAAVLSKFSVRRRVQSA